MCWILNDILLKNYDLQQKLVLYLFQLFKANEFVSQTQDTSQI